VAFEPPAKDLDVGRVRRGLRRSDEDRDLSSRHLVTNLFEVHILVIV
jgi:hypothetical protein